jgi:hypothetical protein
MSIDVKKVARYFELCEKCEREFDTLSDEEYAILSSERIGLFYELGLNNRSQEELEGLASQYQGGQQ